MKIRPFMLLLAAAMASNIAAAAANPPCAVTAAPRSVEYPWMTIARWKDMHAADVAVAEKGGVDLMFIGDSITEGWPEPVWNASFGKYKPANFGIGGDNTGNLLWRLQDPRYARIKPKAIVLLIGVNNFNLCGENTEQVFEGVKAVVAALRKQYPAARILLNAVLPTEEKMDGKRRQDVIKLNTMIATLGDGQQVIFRDYGRAFLQPDGSISKEIMPDFLHLSEKGYQMWSDAMLPDVKKLME